MLNKKIVKHKMYTNSMNIKLAFALMFILIVLPMFSAQTTLTNEQSLGVFKQNEPINLIQYCSNATQGIISAVINPDSSYSISSNQVMTRNGDNFNYTFLNSSQLGGYLVYGNCNGVSWQYGFEVTPNGELSSIQNSIVQVFIMIFFISLIIGFFYLNQKIDYKKWNDSIINKYYTRNIIKVVFSSILYNFIKNTFVIYYLLGFPIILTLVEISYNYNFINVLLIFKTLLFMYSIGIIFVGAYLFSNVQEWIMKFFDDIKNMNWGVN